MKRVAERNWDAVESRVTQRGWEQLGLLVQAAIQRRVVELRTPPNAPATIKAKKSSNPLIDTGLLLTSVTWRLVDPRNAQSP